MTDGASRRHTSTITGELITAAALLALAAFVFVETADYPGSLVRGAPGPAFFPRVLAGALAVLAAAMALTAARGEAGEVGAAGGEAPGGTGRIVLSLTLVVAFVAGVGTLGFFVLLPPLLACVMAIMGERRPAMLVAAPLLFDLFVYVVFYRIFAVDLPTLLL